MKPPLILCTGHAVEAELHVEPMVSEECCLVLTEEEPICDDEVSDSQAWTLASLHVGHRALDHRKLQERFASDE
jgi:hypothetical protein